MRRFMFKSKIHRATVTGADLHYEGSITIDSELLKLADILPYEKVDIYNITNGERFSTYVIPGEPGSGEICLNGAAARKVQKGDLVIIVSYCELEEEEIEDFQPIVVLVDEKNRPVKVSRGSGGLT
ncbi:aspartate 1-decarboxylase [Phorcysia thermohydrogeniphila]|uniref:Aspartate 1-decarboxylase n=1 Tax=Phorcysia thermohydrogeniphila TaxID=936138 RepID=A0A4R1GB70_9BACT|nr:aspartate 1-decarboxylase [Phorcysia thermohydrogeniphila]TCK03910.1 L-aspartate 1-decarboxylase [Phorcysia thermohydrogeniphila]